MCAYAQGGAKGAVTGRIVDDHGHAIASAHVRAIASEGSGGADATADAKGVFRLELDPGQYRLQFEADGYTSFSPGDTVAIEAGHETKLKRKVELREADQGSVIRGSVFTSDGRAIPGAKVVLERIASETNTTFAELKLESSSDRMGIFAFHVPKGEGRYRVTASRDGFTSGSQTVDVSGGEITNIVIRLSGSGEPH